MNVIDPRFGEQRARFELDAIGLVSMPTWTRWAYWGCWVLIAGLLLYLAIGVP